MYDDFDMGRIFDSISDWVSIVDLRDHRIIKSNRASLSVLGLKPEEVVGKVCHTIVQKTDHTHDECPVKKMLISGKRESKEMRIDGGKWSRVVVDPVFDEKGNIVQAIHIVRDITDEKKLEESLRAEMQVAENILEAANVLFIAIDAGGVVTLANDKAAEAIGCPVDEIEGKNWFDHFIPERQRDEIRAVSRQIVNGDLEPVKTYENSILCKDGSEKQILWRNTCLYDDDGKIIGHISSGMDVTDLRKAEQLLEKSECDYRELVENLNDAIFRVDHSGIITYISPVIEKISGYRAEEIVGQHLDKLIFEAGRDSVLDDCSAAPGEENEPRKCRIRSRFGGEGWILVHMRSEHSEGEFAGGLGVISDITRLHRTEAALKESEQKYRSIFHYAKDGIVLANPDNGMIMDCNPEFQRQAGRSLSHLRTMRIWDLRPDDKKEVTERVFKRVADDDDGNGQGSTEIVLLRGDGDFLPVEFHARKIKIFGKAYILIISRDISERKVAERAVLERQAMESRYALTKIMTDIIPPLMTFRPESGVKNAELMREIMLKIDEAFFDRYFPTEVDGLEEFGRNICSLFNDMGGQFDFVLRNDVLHIFVTTCPWRNEVAKNPVLCMMTRGILERFGAKVLGKVSVEQTQSMARGDGGGEFVVKALKD